MLHARSELRSDARVSLDFVAQRLVLPAAVAHATPALLGDSGSVLTGIRSLKWNPELPKSKRLKRKQHASEKSKDHMGVDYGLWVTAMVICEVWLGLKPSPVPADAAVGLARSGECRMPPLATKMEEAPKGKAWCTVDLSQADPVNSCGTPPPPRSAADSLDPRSRLLGFFGFAVVLIGVTLGGTRRSEDG